MGFFVCRARYERRDRERAGKRAAGSNTGKESKPTTDEKKKTERQGAAAERKSESERKEREREISGGGKRAVGALWAVGSKGS